MEKQKKGIVWFGNLQLMIYATVVFGLLFLFVDRDNYFAGEKLKKQIRTLEHQRDYLVRQIEKDSAVVKGIETDPAFLEKYARENYYMLKKGETVYVVDSVKTRKN